MTGKGMNPVLTEWNKGDWTLPVEITHDILARGKNSQYGIDWASRRRARASE
jgi:hypothetical protein